ncbi:MAG: VWA domain-containing protein [Lentisphaeraceae bacterium]|nr:VWA domain-containing protein [Lentisphaeraceae bacterium]
MINTNKYFAISIGISLLFHFLLFNVANRMPAFKTVSSKKVKPVKYKKPVRLKSVTLEDINKKPRLKFDVNIKESPTKLADILKEQGLKEYKSSNLKPKELTDTPAKNLGNSPDLKKLGLSQELPPNIYHIKTAPSQKLPEVAIDSKNNFKNIAIKTPGKGDSMVSPPANSGSGTAQIGLKRSFPKISPPNLKFKDRTPKQNGREISSPVVDPARKNKTADKPGEMEFFLNIRPFVYIDEDEEKGYFRLDLSPNSKAKGIESIKKDVFFLVDSSKSISKAQLNEFKQGLLNGIQSLQPDDRFNVVDFTTEATPCFPGISPNSLDSLNKASEFISDLNSYGKTDVYTSVKPFVTDAVREEGRPILLFVMTDGVSTVSESMENSQIIQKITESNEQNVSVFGFSCGDNINSFLLDFMTYRNRGDSLIINGTQGAANSLSSYIKSRSQILVSDLNYRYMGNHKDDLFPKSLPHLYQNRTLSIFGTFDLNEQESMIQMLGVSSAGKRQLIYKLRYEDAERGSRELAKSWAAQKIFHLIGKLTDKKDQAIIQEIIKLQQKFEVYIPYDLPK